MTDTIDTKNVGTVDGFEINARLVPDLDTAPTDFDCYSPDQVAAWRRGDWGYVGTIVTASRAGIELGSAAIFGSEYGSLPGIEKFVNPLDGNGDDFINGYGPDMITEAITEAKRKLDELAP